MNSDNQLTVSQLLHLLKIAADHGEKARVVISGPLSGGRPEITLEVSPVLEENAAFDVALQNLLDEYPELAWNIRFAPDSDSPIFQAPAPKASPAPKHPRGPLDRAALEMMVPILVGEITALQKRASSATEIARLLEMVQTWRTLCGELEALSLDLDGDGDKTGNDPDMGGVLSGSIID